MYVIIDELNLLSVLNHAVEHSRASILATHNQVVRRQRRTACDHKDGIKWSRDSCTTGNLAIPVAGSSR